MGQGGGIAGREDSHPASQPASQVRGPAAATGPSQALPPGNRSFSPGVVLARVRWISTRVLDKLIRFATFGISVASVVGVMGDGEEEG